MGNENMTFIDWKWSNSIVKNLNQLGAVYNCSSELKSYVDGRITFQALFKAVKAKKPPDMTLSTLTLSMTRDINPQSDHFPLSIYTIFGKATPAIKNFIKLSKKTEEKVRKEFINVDCLASFSFQENVMFERHSKGIEEHTIEINSLKERLRNLEGDEKRKNEQKISELENKILYCQDQCDGLVAHKEGFQQKVKTSTSSILKDVKLLGAFTDTALKDDVSTEELTSARQCMASFIISAIFAYVLNKNPLLAISFRKRTHFLSPRINVPQRRPAPQNNETDIPPATKKGDALKKADETQPEVQKNQSVPQKIGDTHDIEMNTNNALSILGASIAQAEGAPAASTNIKMNVRTLRKLRDDLRAKFDNYKACKDNIEYIHHEKNEYNRKIAEQNDSPETRNASVLQEKIKNIDEQLRIVGEKITKERGERKDLSEDKAVNDYGLGRSVVAGLKPVDISNAIGVKLRKDKANLNDQRSDALKGLKTLGQRCTADENKSFDDRIQKAEIALKTTSQEINRILDTVQRT